MQHLILYAEDDVKIALEIKHFFIKNGYDVKWAINGHVAFEDYLKLKPDIVILDIQMPVFSGLEVAQKIRKSDLHTPIVMLTVDKSSETALKGYKLHIDDYIRKGVKNEEILARVQCCIERRPIRRDRKLILTPDSWLDTVENIIYSCGQTHKIGFRDCYLLCTLERNRNIPLDRKMLEQQIWSDLKKKEKNTDNEENFNKSITALRKSLNNDSKIILQVKPNKSVTLVITE